jgi:hypothetical protein
LYQLRNEVRCRTKPIEKERKKSDKIFLVEREKEIFSRSFNHWNVNVQWIWKYPSMLSSFTNIDYWRLLDDWYRSEFFRQILSANDFIDVEKHESIDGTIRISSFTDTFACRIEIDQFSNWLLKFLKVLFFSNLLKKSNKVIRVTRCRILTPITLNLFDVLSLISSWLLLFYLFRHLSLSFVIHMLVCFMNFTSLNWCHP